MDIDLKQISDIPPVSREAWEAAVAKALGTSTLDRLRAVTSDGIAVPPLSAPAVDRRPLPARGAGIPWSIVQRVVLDEPLRTNTQIKDELTNGADAIDLVFPVVRNGHEDVPTQPSPDLERVFEGVYLDMITVHMSGKHDALNMRKMLHEVAEASGRDGSAIRIRSGNDPIVAATNIHSSKAIQNDVFAEVAAARRLATQCTQGSSVLSCQGQFWHAAGATEAQQLAIALATAVVYLELSSKEAIDGVGPAEIAPLIAFRLVADQNQFLTIAKFRAFRRLWALVLSEWGIDAGPAFVHAETAWSMMTRRDPWVNILRSTVATFAAAVGGADAITTVPHTALLGRPDPAARRLSRNVQTVLMDECNLHRVGDPGAGSGTIEALTDSLAEAAWVEFQQIEREGGLVASLASGAINGRILTARSKIREAVARRRLPITGTSTFPLLAERMPDVEPGDGWRLEGDDLARIAEPWEALRDRSDTDLANRGTRPSIFLANLGPVAAFTARSTWAKNLFEAGGVQAIGRDGFDDPAALAEAFRASGASVACLCSDDATYETLAVAMASALKGAGATRLYLAGRPKEAEADWRAAGVDVFVHEGLDMLDLLGGLHDLLGTPAPKAP